MDEDKDRKDHIANILGVSSQPVKMIEDGVVICQEEVEHDREIDEDIAYVRRMMYDTIANTKDAVKSILEIASQSQHPRAYEVAATLLNTMREANKDLLNLHKSKKELRRQEVESVPTNVQQNLFVGSTAELLQLIKGKKGTDDGTAG